MFYSPEEDQNLYRSFSDSSAASNNCYYPSTLSFSQLPVANIVNNLSNLSSFFGDNNTVTINPSAYHCGNNYNNFEATDEFQFFSDCLPVDAEATGFSIGESSGDDISLCEGDSGVESDDLENMDLGDHLSNTSSSSSSSSSLSSSTIGAEDTQQCAMIDAPSPTSSLTSDCVGSTKVRKQQQQVIARVVPHTSSPNSQLQHIRKGRKSVTIILPGSAERRYVCDICHATTRWRSNLARHKRRHSGEKPYICQHCNASFANSSNRKKHELNCKSLMVDKAAKRLKKEQN